MDRGGRGTDGPDTEGKAESAEDREGNADKGGNNGCPGASPGIKRFIV